MLPPIPAQILLCFQEREPTLRIYLHKGAAAANDLPDFTLHFQPPCDSRLSSLPLCTYVSFWFRYVGGVVHSFTGSADDRDRILAIPKLHIGGFKHES